LAPAVHLFRKQPPFTAIATQFCLVQTGGFQDNRELVGRPPTLWILLRSRNYIPLQPPGLPPVVEGDDVNAQLC
jgi:hypothetical protein